MKVEVDGFASRNAVPGQCRGGGEGASPAALTVSHFPHNVSASSSLTKAAATSMELTFRWQAGRRAGMPLSCELLLGGGGGGEVDEGKQEERRKTRNRNERERIEKKKSEKKFISEKIKGLCGKK